jgi:glycerophosphoryl diester phosphodiesterase
MTRVLASVLCSVLLVGALPAADRRHQAAQETPRATWLIAHRGASAYAPENTVPAFELAAQQGATFVEFDLRLTKDRQIVCLHDDSLERTTDVEAVFPARARAGGTAGTDQKRWLLEDFTLAELKQLDAGAWFDRRFRGTRIPTFGETIDALRGRSGLFIELKSPERYDGIEKLVLAELRASGLDAPGADPRTPVVIQSFTASSLQVLSTTLQTKLPVHFLVGARDAAPWLTDEGLATLRSFATGISPEKTIVRDHPGFVARVRALGLLVTPYTFRAGAVPGFPDVRAEMTHYLAELDVDGVITDNPDQMPTVPARRR